MRIATWNVNGLRARLDFVRAWLAERQPDVVGLQELKLTDDLFPHDAFTELGFRAVTHGQKSWNGVAILAREEPQVTATGLASSLPSPIRRANTPATTRLSSPPVSRMKISRRPWQTRSASAASS